MDTELAYTPVTQAYGHSYESQYIVLICCTEAQTRSVLAQGAGGYIIWPRNNVLRPLRNLAPAVLACFGGGGGRGFRVRYLPSAKLLTETLAV